jgi:hypothetical protein
VPPLPSHRRVLAMYEPVSFFFFFFFFGVFPFSPAVHPSFWLLLLLAEAWREVWRSASVSPFCP